MKFPLKLESNQQYLISFNIKDISFDDNILNNHIHFGFFANGYDNCQQEFNVDHNSINENYSKFNKIINTGNIPPGEDTYLRILTYSSGSLKIENLSVLKIIVNRESGF